jgi:proteasome activator subunit 4
VALHHSRYFAPVSEVIHGYSQRIQNNLSDMADQEPPRKRLKVSRELSPTQGAKLRNMEEGYTNGRNHVQLLQNLLQNGGPNDTISRATSPGLGFSSNGMGSERDKRYRPRTFPYFQLLPYGVEEESERNIALDEILKQLYIAIKAEDIQPGAVHWTRELKAWLNLKFEITRELRIKLVHLYYMLSLAPGMDWVAADRFESMFRFLLK